MQDTLIVEEREINAHGSRRTVGEEEVGLYFGPLLGRSVCVINYFRLSPPKDLPAIICEFGRIKNQMLPHQLRSQERREQR